MRYILIDPFAQTVTEASDPDLAYEQDKPRARRHLATLYRIMGCYGVEWQNMRLTPKHDILMDEDAGLQKPQRPTFGIGNQHLIGKAVILGRRGRSSIACSLPLAKVQASVRFDVGPKVVQQREFKTFDTLEEMQAFRAAMPVPRWL